MKPPELREQVKSLEAEAPRLLRAVQERAMSERVNAAAPVIRCRFCGASSEDSKEQSIERMEGCNNCRIDVQLRGQWTNVGWRIVQAIAKREAKP